MYVLAALIPARCSYWGRPPWPTKPRRWPRGTAAGLSCVRVSRIEFTRTVVSSSELTRDYANWPYLGECVQPCMIVTPVSKETLRLSPVVLKKPQNYCIAHGHGNDQIRTNHHDRPCTKVQLLTRQHYHRPEYLVSMFVFFFMLCYYASLDMSNN